MMNPVSVGMNKTVALGAGRCRQKSPRETPILWMGQKGHLWEVGWEVPISGGLLQPSLLSLKQQEAAGGAVAAEWKWET